MTSKTGIKQTWQEYLENLLAEEIENEVLNNEMETQVGSKIAEPTLEKVRTIIKRSKNGKAAGAVIT